MIKNQNGTPFQLRAPFKKPSPEWNPKDIKLINFQNYANIEKHKKDEQYIEFENFIEEESVPETIIEEEIVLIKEEIIPEQPKIIIPEIPKEEPKRVSHKIEIKKENNLSGSPIIYRQDKNEIKIYADILDDSNKRIFVLPKSTNINLNGKFYCEWDNTEWSIESLKLEDDLIIQTSPS